MNLLYLSGAPRVSTLPNAGTSGPRAHILGVIKGFETNGYNVHKAIAGDVININKQGNRNMAKQLSDSATKRMVADVFRLIYRYYFRLKFKRQNKEKYDIVYERLAAMQALGQAFKSKNTLWVLETNAPLFYEANEARKSTFLPRLIKYFEIKAYKECDYLVCISNKLKEIILAEANIPEGKTIVMPNGVDIDKFNTQEIQPKYNFPELTIGFVGTIQPWQKLDFLFTAAAELIKEGFQLKLLIVGDGIDSDRLKETPQTLNIENNVVFTGRVPWNEVPAYIKSFHVGYSAPEAMEIGLYVSPLKLYEYMASGVPALASATEDSKNLITHRKNGFLFQHGNINDLKQTIKDIINHKNELADIGAAAKTEILNNHTWEHRVKFLLTQINNSMH
ncbi:glycosyltransferase family 4 protein [Parafilimonas sp.]|uniref:glycosyltransferase family 4 protein n=1 Tax=Parafilimonas sp. TaxID=1969739 RepID=UPI0039E6734E